MKLFKLYVILFLFLLTNISFAQVSKASIVEHFTNTSCSICAANNNNFYNIIKNNPNTIHISFHPSSPYANDFFNQQNKIENDARTKYYDVYGGTPQLVVNGKEINNPALNTTLKNEAATLANFKINVAQEQFTSSQIKIKIVITKIAADTTSSALFFTALSEDTINQTTNNGEKFHYNVFRKSLTNIVGDKLTLPLTINDSIVFNYNYTIPSNWDISKISTISLLQKMNNELINAAKSINTINLLNSTSESKHVANRVMFYPNPSTNGIIYAVEDIKSVALFSLTGQSLYEFSNVKKDTAIGNQSLTNGTYIVKGIGQKGEFYQIIIIQ